MWSTHKIIKDGVESQHKQADYRSMMDPETWNLLLNSHHIEVTQK